MSARRISRVAWFSRVLTFCAVIAVLLVSTSGVAADGAGAVSVTQLFNNAPFSLAMPNPCSGVPGTFMGTFNGVAHATVLTSGNGAGTGWFTFTGTGDFVFTPNNSTNPTFTGHITSWDGQSFNLQNFATTGILVINGTGSDGSRLTFHDVMHASVSANGIILSFDKPTCG